MEDRGSQTGQDPSDPRSFNALYVSVIAMLLFFGVELWFLVMHGLGIRPGQPLIIGIAAVLAMVRPVARGYAGAGSIGSSVAGRDRRHNRFHIRGVVCVSVQRRYRTGSRF